MANVEKEYSKTVAAVPFSCASYGKVVGGKKGTSGAVVLGMFDVSQVSTGGSDKSELNKMSPEFLNMTNILIQKD